MDVKLLIVDDEPTLLETIELRLQKEGFSTFTASSAEEGMRIYKRVQPDLVVLDIMLPQRNGYEFCSAVRKESNTPIIFVTAKADDADRIKGFDIGADDYITKPFNLGELTARIKAVLRRSNLDLPLEAIESGDLSIDPQTHTVLLAGKELALSPKEFALLYFLVKNSGKVFGRTALLDRVWGKDAFVTERTIDVHIRWLRKRIEVNEASPTRLVTIRGVGYKFVG